MNKLQACYDKIAIIMGSDIESYSSVELVERYRRFWKPHEVKIILLAESHVFTTDEVRDSELKKIEELSAYPSAYARFVYCLAYGESDLLQDTISFPNSGTPQFWKILYSCANQVTSNSCFNSVQKSTTGTESRIQNKINLLLRLKEQGIWLVDISIVALYNKGKKPRSKIMSNCMKASWENYTRDIVNEAKPSHVIIIGKGVASIITDLPFNYTVIAQPNAHLSAEQHMKNFQLYYQLCNI